MEDKLQRKLEKFIKVECDEWSKEAVRASAVKSDKFDPLDMVYFDKVFERIESTLTGRKRRRESIEEGEVSN